MNPLVLALILAVSVSTAICGCDTLKLFDPVQLSDSDRTALLEKAEATQRAYETGDVDAIIQSTHPAILKFFPSREQFEATIRKAFESLKDKVFFEKTDWGVPTPVFESGNDEVCFVPMTSIMRVGPARARSLGFLIAAREKGTNGWLFLDCAALRKDSSLLWKLFPDLPMDVPLPPNMIEALK